MADPVIPTYGGPVPHQAPKTLSYGQIAGRAVLIAASILLLLSVAYVGLFRPAATVQAPTSSAQNSDVVALIYQDSAVYHLLYMRWTFVDWLLTFFAAGTAVSAAIKNAYSVKQDAQVSASWLDVTLMVLAVLAVLATTFDAKLQAGQLGERYRAGDLILQDAKMNFEASDKQDVAKAKLLASWQQAQNILEQKSLTDKAPAAGGTNKDDTPPSDSPGK